MGRVTNVIKGAEFTMNGTSYKVSANYGKNTLNGKLLLIYIYIYIITWINKIVLNNLEHRWL